MEYDKKITPSQDLQLAWLAGIFDGEGSIGLYQTKNKGYIIGLVIVNTDLAILKRVEKILKRYKIYYSKYSRNRWQHKNSFVMRKECFEIKVSRRDETEKFLPLIYPYLIGIKRQRASKVLKYLKAHPRFKQLVYVCKLCRKKFTGRKKQYCSQVCWHKHAKGSFNPNFRHGKYVNWV